MKYRIKLKPLGKYFFGGEKGFNASTYKDETHRSYYIKSRSLPQQTSILGMLRFEVLKQTDDFQVKKYYEYSSKERDEMNALIGPVSFSIEEKSQEFGLIKSISPVQMFHQEKGILIKTPLDHTNNDNNDTGYNPYTLKTYDGFSNHEGVSILKEYNAKDGLANHWLTSDNQIVKNEEIFQIHALVGNKIIDKHDENDEDKGFYKQDFKTLASGFHFTFTLDIDDSLKLEDSIVELGKERSSFFMTIEKITDEDEFATDEDKIVFKSDAFLTREQLDRIRENTKFSIVQEKEFRNLRRKKDSKHYQFIETKYNFIERGSVYYPKANKKSEVLNIIRENNNLLTIGYNQVN